MKRHPLTYLLAALWLLPACNLEQDIEVNLPDYESELVVECYLEPGKPYRLLLSESQAYFDSAIENPFIEDATVSITHQGVEVPLQFGTYFDPEFTKFYNYASTETVPDHRGEDFHLNILDDRGRAITATTRILPTIHTDSLVVEFNSTDTAALLLTYFKDPDGPNWYRRQLHLGETINTSEIQQDFIADDNITTEDNTFVFGSGYDYTFGDTLFTTLYHIDEPYFDFLESVFNASSSNGNPFATPASIRSNVQGGIGIFTGLAYDRDTIIIE